MSGLALSLLGPLTITLDDRPFGGIRIRPALALLVYLACRPERQHREHLMSLLWPDWSPASAQQNLRQNLYVLRQVIPQVTSHDGSPVPLLLADRGGLQLNPDAGVSVDVLPFATLLERPHPTATQLAEAVALYRGDFLVDFYLPDSEPFEEWAAARRADLRRRMLAALDGLTTGALEQRASSEAMAYARRQLELDNLNESAHRQLMLALAQSGLRASALAHYEECRRLLRQELGVEPSAELRALAERIAGGEEERGAPVVESPVRHNLPLQLSSFIGRERELAEVRLLLLTSRLVTLAGAGGSGKTRLALEVATRLVDDFTGGVRFVDLAPLSDPAVVGSTVAAALGVTEEKGRPLFDTLVSYLRSRQLLLLLDNCEHLMAAVPELAGALLRHCPDLHILATSREPLGIAGEVVWLAPTLALPASNEPVAVEELAHYDAIRLFVERATAALPVFALSKDNAAAVTQVCRRLDGIPLAIELAAARVKLLRVEQIVTRLDDRFRLLAGGSRAAPPRHQTLRALIDWSHDLLSPAEQRLLRRLSVFAGGFTLEAAEEVTSDELRVTSEQGQATGDATKVRGQTYLIAGEILDLLAGLVNKSLVVANRAPGRETRYELHETIRQYAWNKLKAAGEAGPVQERHADYYGRILEAALPRFFYDDRVVLHRDWLEAEMENWRAVMGRSLVDGAIGAEWGIRAATRLGGFWIVYSRLEEATRWLGAAAARAGEASLAVRANFYVRVTIPAVSSLRLVEDDKAADALAIFRQLEDKEGIVFATCRLALTAPDPEQAKTELEQIMPLAAEIGPESLSMVYFGLAWRAGLVHDYHQAITWGEKYMSYYRELPYHRIIVAERSRMVGAYYRFAGDVERATALIQEGLEAARGLDIGGEITALLLNGLGENARYQKQYDRANDYYRQALAVARETHHTYPVAMVLGNMALCQITQGDARGAKAIYREFLAVLRQGVWYDEMFDWALWDLAQIAELEEDMERAAFLHGAAESWQKHVVMSIVGADDLEDINRHVARVRARLGEEIYSAAWAEGQCLSAEEIIAFAEKFVAGAREGAA